MWFMLVKLKPAALALALFDGGVRRRLGGILRLEDVVARRLEPGPPFGGVTLMSSWLITVLSGVLPDSNQSKYRLKNGTPAVRRVRKATGLD